MLRMHVAHPADGSADGFIEGLGRHSAVEIAGRSSTASGLSSAIGSDDFHVVLLPPERADIARTVRAARSTPGTSSFIVFAERRSTPLLALSLANGFDAVVETSSPSDEVVDLIVRVVNKEWHLESEPALSRLGLTRGLLAKRLHIDSHQDGEIADLVGTGIPDDEIAELMQMSIQLVRNRIEHLLATNELQYRTQLAVLRASQLKVADLL